MPSICYYYTCKGLLTLYPLCPCSLSPSPFFLLASSLFLLASSSLLSLHPHIHLVEGLNAAS